MEIFELSPMHIHACSFHSNPDLNNQSAFKKLQQTQLDKCIVSSQINHATEGKSQMIQIKMPGPICKTNLKKVC